MIYVLLAAVALSVLPSGPSAQSSVLRLNVSPMAAPNPALKYLLLPEVRELSPGNPAQWYLRCFQEARYFFFKPEATAERSRYLAMRLADLPAEKLRHYGGGTLKQADWAARLDSLDWQVLERIQNDGLSLMLPELGPFGILAKALQVRFRAQVAGQHFDEAVTSSKTMLALARHLGEYPAEAANRLGLAIASQTLDSVEEMLQQPGCPNLYWALTDLPSPLVDIRKGLQGSRCLMAAELKTLKDDAAMSESQLDELVGGLSGKVGFAREQAGQTPRSLRAPLQARARDSERVRAAAGRLVQAGCTQSIIRTLPPLQVILLDEKRAYEVQADEAMKLVGLALWQIDAQNGGPYPARPQGRRKKISSPGGNEEGLFADMFPCVIELRHAQGRLEQRIALLRHVEALRLFAANHEGKLPQTLSDVAVPLPPDPFTGKAFEYKADGMTAQLRGSRPRGEDKNVGTRSCYEVVLRR
jgi:hypothetical protein